MPPGRQLLTFILGCLYLINSSCATTSSRSSLAREPVQPCVPYSGFVREFITDTWIVQSNFSACQGQENTSKILRVFSESANVSISSPIVFFTRIGSQVQSWQLPLKSDIVDDYDFVTHTICSNPLVDKNKDFVMEVFTSSAVDVEYSFEFRPVENFVLQLNQMVNFNISANEPQLYYFKIPEGRSSVRVVASTQSESNCAVVSIQNASCPVNDQLENARSKGEFQTMIKSASLVVTANKTITNDEFFAVIYTAGPKLCANKRREKGKKEEFINSTNSVSIELTVIPLRQAKSYIFAIFLPVIIFGVVGVSTFIIVCLSDQFHRRKKGDNVPSESTPMINSQDNDDSKGKGEQSDDSLIALFSKKEKDVTLPDLLRSGYVDLERSYKVYGWNTITVGIFYALPAFQLVFSQQLILDESGDQDICYYNFKCARPYGVLSAFNNVWSNVGYFIMGLTFLGIVKIRHYHANQQLKSDETEFNKYGIPHFFGVYYAMGFGMIMEAFMSAFYHICPSDNNFQFDTAFMFIIGGLLIVKMLQVRHPDIQANAFVAFFCFAIVIFLTFVGIWEWSKPYWQTKFTLGLLALIGIIVFAVSYYFLHDWKLGKIIDWFKSWCDKTKEMEERLLPRHPYRFFKMSFLVVANFVVGILLVIVGKGIATVVLALFIVNFLVLMMLYILCKLRYREPCTVMPVVFVILVAACWGGSFYFYFSNVSQWEFSPAESRNLNKECIALDFYDNHDIWHFLSAGALFFSFMFLFTLDDGLRKKERKLIKVF